MDCGDHWCPSAILHFSWQADKARLHFFPKRKVCHQFRKKNFGALKNVD